MAEEAKLHFDVDPNDFQNIEQVPDQTISEPAPEPIQEVEPDINLENAENNQESNDVQEGTEEAIEQAEPLQEEQSQEILDDSVELIEEIEEIEEIVEQPQEAAEQYEEEPAEFDDLPEGIDKLVEFIQETGGTLEDYIALNRDFDSYSEDQLLLEYYSQSRPHWSKQDIMDHIEDEFNIENYEDGMELDRDERRKLRNRKEEIFKAKQFLQGNKEKYYENIKMSSQAQSLQQQKQQQEIIAAQERIRNDFQSKTKELFAEDFKGFEFTGGEKKFRIKGSPEALSKSQMDLNDVIGEHLSQDGTVKDINAYHKALYAFKNADKIFDQAYQQGKADALKERATSTKNIDMTPKTTETRSSINKKASLNMDVDPFGVNSNNY